MIALLMDMTLALHGKVESNLVQFYPAHLVVGGTVDVIKYKYTVYAINQSTDQSVILLLTELQSTNCYYHYLLCNSTMRHRKYCAVYLGTKWLSAARGDVTVSQCQLIKGT